jgi:hypothetical protein
MNIHTDARLRSSTVETPSNHNPIAFGERLHRSTALTFYVGAMCGAILMLAALVVLAEVSG